MPEYEWDEGNVEHLAEHGITTDEVEEVLDGSVVRQRGRTHAADRHYVLGRTLTGRYLVVIYQQKARNLLRPITGWEMNRNERRLYERQIGS